MAAVFGGSNVAQLRDLEPRWLRKAGITWMLRCGRSLTERARDLLRRQLGGTDVVAQLLADRRSAGRPSRPF